MFNFDRKHKSFKLSDTAKRRSMWQETGTFVTATSTRSNPIVSGKLVPQQRSTPSDIASPTTEQFTRHSRASDYGASFPSLTPANRCRPVLRPSPFSTFPAAPKHLRPHLLRLQAAISPYKSPRIPLIPFQRQRGVTLKSNAADNCALRHFRLSSSF